MSTREVVLTGGSPWGFRMHGGVDVNQPLRISRVNPGRKAALSGIREGDVISSINGHPTRSMSNTEAHAMLKNSGMTLKLGLNEESEVSPRRKSSGKLSTLELKRPSQLIAEIQSGRSTPQSHFISPLSRSSQSPMRASPLFQAPPSLARSSIPTITPPNYAQLSGDYSRSAYSSLPPSSIYSTVSKLPLPTTARYDRAATKSLSTSPRTPSHSDYYSKSSLLSPGSSKALSDKISLDAARAEGRRSPNVTREVITSKSVMTEHKQMEIEEVKRIERIVFNGGMDPVNCSANWDDRMDKKTCNGYIQAPDRVSAPQVSTNPFYQPPFTDTHQDYKTNQKIEVRGYPNGYYSSGLSSGTITKPPSGPQISISTRPSIQDSDSRSKCIL